MFHQEITVPISYLFAGVIAAHYLCKGLDWLQDMPKRRRARAALEKCQALLDQMNEARRQSKSKFEDYLRTATNGHVEFEYESGTTSPIVDFAQPTPEQLEQLAAIKSAATRLNPMPVECMFMARIHRDQDDARRILGQPSRTSNGNSISL